MSSINEEQLKADVLKEIELSQTLGEECNVEWVELGTDVGYSIRGWGLGATRFLDMLKEAMKLVPEGKPLNVLEIGPGLGEIVPEVLKLGCNLSLIGEPHHIDAIVDKYGNLGNLTGHGGWFPQDLPGNEPGGSGALKYDFIFASRVVHCTGLEMANKTIKAIHEGLVPGGTAVIETTSPWSSYYQPFHPDFIQDVIKEGSLDAVSGFEVNEEAMIREGCTPATVCLFTIDQAKKAFDAPGFDVEVEPFRMTAHPNYLRGNPPLRDQMLSVVVKRKLN